MWRELPEACRELADRQRGVLSREQVLRTGLDSSSLARLVRSGRWQQLGRGVYALFSGEPPRHAVLWAAVLRAGAEAALSHRTAAELYGLTDRPAAAIYVTIPETRRIHPIAGLVIHRSRRLAEARHPALLPPRTRIEETVLDLVADSETLDSAFGWLSAACQRRLTTAAHLRAALSRRRKVRWRTQLIQALGDIGSGEHSLLEHGYVRRVERPHGLPAAIRQARLRRGSGNQYLDGLYAEFGVGMELDGLVAHPAERRWEDVRRDNAAAAIGLITLRYNWADVTQRPCQTAVQVGEVLRSRGWTGSLRRCGPRCAVSAG
jgi:hypothetical protein